MGIKRKHLTVYNVFVFIYSTILVAGIVFRLLTQYN